MSRFRKSKTVLFVAFLLATVLIFPFIGLRAATPPVFAALGDSTGYGLSAFPGPTNRNLATLYGFNDQFADHLADRYGSVSYTNKAWPGDKTADLLADLDDSGIKAQISGSNIITVMIGGNNLLTPAIASICGLWGVNPADYDDLDGKDMLEALAAAIAFHGVLLRGVADLKKDWPAIARKLRSLNRHAEIYVCTVHNPIQVTSSADPLYPLYVEFEMLLGSINWTIRCYALYYRYRVVDINKAFKSTAGALTFDIAGAVEAATYMAALGPIRKSGWNCLGRRGINSLSL